MKKLSEFAYLIPIKCIFIFLYFWLKAELLPPGRAMVRVFSTLKTESGDVTDMLQSL